jgi:histone H3/H4
MDKTSDFSFMKTGFDPAGDGLSTDYKQTVVSMLTLFGENALHGGALYTKHANRQVITPEDIKRAMMLEVFVYTKRPDTLERVETIRKELFGREEEKEEESEEECDGCSHCEQPFKESECECALCQCLNTIYERWVQWEPQTQIEILLKKHIDTIKS